ncbi:MAG: ribonuclease III [Clostridia bacterium]|nr:ribonuclease III [Clostridia bacterium]
MERNKLKSVSCQALAYLGDCVLEMCVREYLVELGYSRSAKLNSAALDFVRAPKQAEAMKNILPILTEDEESVFKRGRNIGHTSTPKSATFAEYRAATGMEALFGYLHLEGKSGRIKELFALAYKINISEGEENEQSDN